MIESIIAEYLQDQRRLVIPKLGAFLKKESGETVFVPFLNRDDGILTARVGKVYGISRAEAESVVSQYAEGISRGIELHGFYLAAPLGTLKRDPNGILYLDADDLSPVSTGSAASESGRVDSRPVAGQPVVLESAPERSVAPEVPVAKPDVPRQSVEKADPPAPSPVFRTEPELSVESRHSALETPAAKSVTHQPAVEKRGSASETAKVLLVPSEPEEVRTVGNSVHAPKTFHDLLLEREKQQEEQDEKPSPTPSKRTRQPEPEPAPVRKSPAPHVAAQASSRRPAPASKNEKRGDLVLILAIVVAVIAIIAMIYAYAVVDLPRLDLH